MFLPISAKSERTIFTQHWDRQFLHTPNHIFFMKWNYFRRADLPYHKWSKFRAGSIVKSRRSRNVSKQRFGEVGPFTHAYHFSQARQGWALPGHSGQIYLDIFGLNILDFPESHFWQSGLGQFLHKIWTDIFFNTVSEHVCAVQIEKWREEAGLTQIFKNLV